MASPMPSWRKTTAVQVGRVITGSSKAIMPCWPSNTASFMGSESAMRTSTPQAMYSPRRWRCSSSSEPASSSRRQAAPERRACFTSFSSQGIHGVGRAGKLHVFPFHLGEHAPVFGGGLRGFGDDAQEIQRAAAALALGVQRFQVVDQGRSSAARSSASSCSSTSPLSGQISGNRQAGLHGGEELGLFLHHLRETPFHQAVQHLIDLLPGDVGARGQLQRLEAGMPEQHQVGTRFVGVQPKLLQAPPEALKTGLRQFFAHIPFTLPDAV